MKKYLLLATSLLLSIVLVACGSEEPKEEKKDTAQATDKAPSEKEKLLKSMDEHRKNKDNTETKDKAETFVISEEAKKMAVEQVMSNDLVKDAYIGVKGNKVTMSVVVNAAVTKDAAKQIGDNFVRNLGGFAGGKGPEKDYYGEVFDNYDLQIGVGTSAKDIMVQGYKATSAKRINW
ncbi:TPA: hypothetical protein QCQ12_003074 [Bacillus cereus biovar anthracis]|nr:hypothetical protein [Bacillus cereus biovar anthracis]